MDNFRVSKSHATAFETSLSHGFRGLCFQIDEQLIDGNDYPKVMKFSELTKLTPEEEAEEDSDHERFIEDSERFSGRHI